MAFSFAVFINFVLNKILLFISSAPLESIRPCHIETDARMRALHTDKQRSALTERFYRLSVSVSFRLLVYILMSHGRDDLMKPCRLPFASPTRFSLFPFFFFFFLFNSGETTRYSSLYSEAVEGVATYKIKSMAPLRSRFVASILTTRNNKQFVEKKTRRSFYKELGGFFRFFFYWSR